MNSPDSSPHELGRCGEEIACRYLQARGYRILERGFRFHRTEIDIIALDGQTLVFIEVKTRRDDQFGFPEEAVTPAKQARIRASAAGFLAGRHTAAPECRFDILSLTLHRDGHWEINHIKDAF